MIELQGFKIVDGVEFVANINGRSNVKGKITVEEGKVYLCQDCESGSPCSDRKGYLYSWYFDSAVQLLYVGTIVPYEEAKLIVSKKLHDLLCNSYFLKVNGESVEFKLNIKPAELTTGGNYSFDFKSEYNCFDIRNGAISYFRGKQELNANEKWNREGRQTMKPSLFLNIFKKHLPRDEKKRNRFIELFSSAIKSGKVDVLVSENVGDIYCTPTSKESCGTLGSSCMRPEADYTGKCYVNTYDHIKGLKIAYSLDKKSELSARALLWHNVQSENGIINFMDRIYGTEDAIAAFKEWAHENGYYHKIEQSYSNNNLINASGEIVSNLELKRAINLDDVNGFPYVDTMHYIQEDGTIGTAEGGYDLQCTSGDMPSFSECDCCGRSGRDVNTTLDTSRQLCEECSTYISNSYCEEGWYEYTIERRIDGWWYTLPSDWEDEEYVWIEYKDGYYYIDKVEKCEECGEWFLRDHMYYDSESEEYYCKEHYEKLIEERENELCESEDNS